MPEGVKISAFSPVDPALSTDTIPVVRGSANVKTTLAEVVVLARDGLTKADVGLGNVDNTTDAAKPVSTATQSALDGKQPLATVLTNTTAAFTSAQETKLSGIETGAEVNAVDSVASKTGIVTLEKADVGLGNVDNTTDAAKPVSTATQSALDGKQPLIVTAVTAFGSIGGGTRDVVLSAGVRSFSGTVDTAETTFTFSTPLATGNEDIFTLRLANGGSQIVNWPASVQWAGGTAPTLTTSGVDEFVFKTIDGGTIWVGVALLDVQ